MTRNNTGCRLGYPDWQTRLQEDFEGQRSSFQVRTPSDDQGKKVHADQRTTSRGRAQLCGNSYLAVVVSDVVRAVIPAAHHGAPPPQVSCCPGTAAALLSSGWQGCTNKSTKHVVLRVRKVSSFD